MRLHLALAATAIACLPTVASAYCFSIYTPSNQLVYQSTASPIDLSQPISAGLRARYPDHHLVFIRDTSRCNTVGTLSDLRNFASAEVRDASAMSTALGIASLAPAAPRRRADRQ